MSYAKNFSREQTFVVVEARIETRLSILDIRASCFDTSVATRNRLTIHLNGLRNLNP